MVVMAVFQSTKNLEGRLLPTAFKGAALHRGEVSLCRLSYTTRQTFEDQVVAPRGASDPLIGVVMCATSDLRLLGGCPVLC
jgi:hypothetical protein